MGHKFVSVRQEFDNVSETVTAKLQESAAGVEGVQQVTPLLLRRTHTVVPTTALTTAPYQYTTQHANLCVLQLILLAVCHSALFCPLTMRLALTACRLYASLCHWAFDLCLSLRKWKLCSES